MKTCNKCKETKSFDSFHKAKAKKDGLSTICKSCKSITDNIYRLNNLEKIRERQQRWESNNRGHCNAKYREYAANNRERRRKLVSISIKKKPWLNAAREAKRRAIKLSATPLWANIEAIKDIYEGCPTGHHVDHIVPLQGKVVCGLHVEHNLQYLSALDNIRKSNLF